MNARSLIARSSFLIKEKAMAKMLPGVLAGAAALLMTACASVQNDAHSYKDGWRRAKVLEIGPARSMTHAVSKDCRQELGDGAPDARYAIVSYSFGGRPTLRAKRLVPAPNDQDLAVDDWVYVDVSDCTKPLDRAEAR